MKDRDLVALCQRETGASFIVAAKTLREPWAPCTGCSLADISLGPRRIPLWQCPECSSARLTRSSAPSFPELSQAVRCRQGSK